VQIVVLRFCTGFEKLISTPLSASSIASLTPRKSIGIAVTKAVLNPSLAAVKATFAPEPPEKAFGLGERYMS
jgi:hypothetical protein